MSAHHHPRLHHRRQASSPPPAPHIRPDTPPQDPDPPSSNPLRTPTHSLTARSTTINKNNNNNNNENTPYTQSSFPAPFFETYNDTTNDGNSNTLFPITEADASATTSFSPGKARTQARQTARLTVLKSWLLSLTSRTRNDDDDDDDRQRGLHSEVSTSTQQKMVTDLVRRWETEYLSLQHSTSVSSPGTTATTTSASTSLAALATQGLEALQSLMMWDTQSRERNRLLGTARREELGELLLSSSSSAFSRQRSDDRVGDGEDGQILGILEGCLTPAAARSLDSLAETAVVLGVSITHGDDSAMSTTTVLDELADPIFELTGCLQRMQMWVREAEVLRGRVERETTEAKGQVEGFERERTKPQQSSDLGGEEEDERGDGTRDVMEMMQMQTGQWVREGRQIGVKIQEYRDRIAVLEGMGRGSSGRGDKKNERKIEDVVRMLEEVERKQKVVRGLEEEVKEFHGLPPDLEASRQEVRRARAELQRLRSKREEIFERLADKR